MVALPSFRFGKFPYSDLRHMPGRLSLMYKPLDILDPATYTSKPASLRSDDRRSGKKYPTPPT